MSVLSRVLRSGEGKKLKAIESLVPDINSLEPEIEKLYGLGYNYSFFEN